MWTQTVISGQANKFKGSKLKYSDPCGHGMAVTQSCRNMVVGWGEGGGNLDYIHVLGKNDSDL